jgi:hypothetical protein
VGVLRGKMYERKESTCFLAIAIASRELLLQEWGTLLYHLILSGDLLSSQDPIERVAAQPD